MHIQGTAFRGEFGTAQGMAPDSWTVPPTVPLTVNYDMTTPLGTASLIQAEDGTITVDVTFDESYRTTATAHPYLGVCLVGGAPTNTVSTVALLAATNDPQLPAWVEIV